MEYTAAPQPPPGELTLEKIKHAYPHLFEGLGKLGPSSFKLNSEVQPIQAIPHRYSAPTLPTIKEALDKLIDNGQRVRVSEAIPWISNRVVRERPATESKPAKVRICLDPSQTINRAIIGPVYPIPTLEENTHSFYKAKLFFTFDIKGFSNYQALLKSPLCLQLCILLGDDTDGHVFHLGSAQLQKSFSEISTMLFVI